MTMKKLIILIVSLGLLSACMQKNDAEKFLGSWVGERVHSSLYFDSLSTIELKIEPYQSTSSKDEKVAVNVRVTTVNTRNNRHSSTLKDHVAEREATYHFYVVGDHMMRHSPDDQPFIQYVNGELKGLVDADIFAMIGVHKDVIYVAAR